MNADHPLYWIRIGHYYEPIPLYRGEVLKYAGIATYGNRDHMMAKPGMLLLGTNKGDRIRATDHSVFTGFGCA